jgi:hypothetical protein
MGTVFPPLLETRHLTNVNAISVPKHAVMRKNAGLAKKIVSGDTVDARGRIALCFAVKSPLF